MGFQEVWAYFGIMGEEGNSIPSEDTKRSRNRSAGSFEDSTTIYRRSADQPFSQDEVARVLRLPPVVEAVQQLADRDVEIDLPPETLKDGTSVTVGQSKVGPFTERYVRLRRPNFGEEYLHIIEPIAQSPKEVHTPPKLAPVAQLLLDKRIITREGLHQVPLSLAAERAQAPQSTLLEWIKNGKKFHGKLIRTYTSAATGALYITEESVERLTNRFVKWPSKEAAGPVVIGETDDRSGFLGLPDAWRILGISNRTMYLWATRGKAPTDKPLTVIRCTASEHFYILEKDVYELRKLVPRTGLHRGRRPHLTIPPP
jgi:hypothetical protein